MKNRSVMRRLSALLLTGILTLSAVCLPAAAATTTPKSAFKAKITSLTVNTSTISIKPKSAAQGRILMVGYSAENKMIDCQSRSTTSGSSQKLTFNKFTDESITKISFIFTDDNYVPIGFIEAWDGKNITQSSELPEDPC